MANKTKLNKTQRQYWENRQLELFSEYEEDALELAEELEEQYKIALKTIEQQINAFYGKYAVETGLDMKTIRKLLDKAELKDFNSQLEEYIKFLKENDAVDELLDEARLLKYKTNISRLTELETNIKYEIAKLEISNAKKINSKMGDIYSNVYLENIFNVDKFNGMSISFTGPNTKAIEKYLKQGFNIANYSVGPDKTWQKVESLSNILSQKIPQGLILGQNPKKVAKAAEKTLHTDYNNIVRLVRTEYNYILNQATKDSYKECGINQYQFLVALDERTCDNCGQYDLYIGDYSRIEVGLNYPPLHPNCRCTTIPYFEPDEFDINNDRIAKDENNKPYMVSADLTFKEWKAGLTEHKGGVMYFKN